MNVVIAGGSGLIGSKLTEMLIEQGHTVFILTRKRANKQSIPNVHYVEWLTDGSTLEKKVSDVDVIINLAGESIASGRWTNERKQRILASRIQATNALIEWMKQLETKPSVFISASGINYYGKSLNKTFTEDSFSEGDDFLSYVTKEWERAASKAEAIGIRTVYARIGVVLDQTGGALPKLLLPYRLFVGGTIGSGHQWLSWIHLEDLARMFLFAMNNEEITGPLNVTAPHPLQMKACGKVIAKTLNRPHWLPAPSLAIQLLLGEMSLLVLGGQKVLPAKACAHGFEHLFTKFDSALRNILNG